MAHDPYPVFKSGTAEQQRSTGGGGGGGLAAITKGVLVGLTAILVIGFSAVAISNCREDAGHEAAKTVRRQDREGLEACETDPLSSQCTSYKARHQGTTAQSPTSREPGTPTEPEIRRDSGCPVAASRFLKAMRACGLNADGISEEMLCSSIDTMAIRMVADSESCAEFSRFLQLGN
jgi:hypothetical protein